MHTPTKTPAPILALALAIECPAVHETDVADEAIANAPARLKRAIYEVGEMFKHAPTDSEEEAALAQVLADLTEHAVALYLPDEDEDEDEDEDGEG